LQADLSAPEPLAGERWIDTHCHLDAQEFGALALMQRALAASKGVAHCVLPAVWPDNFGAVRELACAGHDSYALGIHPLYVAQLGASALQQLERALQQQVQDPRLVAVGEIGLDFFLPALCTPAMRALQHDFFLAQLRLARRFDLPVLLHSRRAVDAVLAGLRAVAGPGGRWHGIAHAFNGSVQQAHALLALGLKLGFGGACTFERALQLRRLAADLPLDAIVLETDAPDMPPQWLYASAAQRAAGAQQPPNSPAELPRIGAALARLRGCSVADWAGQTCRNARQALPRLVALGV